ncbi:MAG: DUF4442 domain-containing protein [Chlorobi bacterium]|nr:DUF4442 domain-containing protein [Chlorobiota bacterium]
MYQKIFKILKVFFRTDQIFKYGFNFSPMYRRTVGRIIYISKDLMTVKIKIPLNYKNRNYTGSIFGGSLFSATDPIFMIQLIQILGDNYIVWDKMALIKYKRPARENVFASFEFTKEEINDIKQRINELKEINICKKLKLTGSKGIVYAELEKTLYIASKDYYKKKTLKRENKNNTN